MTTIDPVISGIGAITPVGIGKESFWRALEAGENGVNPVKNFSPRKLQVPLAAEVTGFIPEEILGPKGLRNLDRSALLLMAAAKQALDDARFVVTEKNTDTVGVATGTTFSHLAPIAAFDREVFSEGIEFTNPALFPATVINAASSQVSIRFNIQGFNATVSTGFTSGIESLAYALNALRTRQAKTVLAGSVDILSYPLLFGFHRLGYVAGLTGPAISCPFDTRRNGPVPGEGSAVLIVEDMKTAVQRKAVPWARVKSVVRSFSARGIAKIHPRGAGLEKAVRQAMDSAGLNPKDIDYISSCANSTQDLDRIECLVLKNVFGAALARIPVSAIKSMIGESYAAAGTLQMISVIGAMHRGLIPPTINSADQDAACAIDCVPNAARKKRVRHALITSFGPGGYNSACILEKI
jgi:3-oxoacyl-[acyl-carrier-protein] synthase II